MSEKTLPAGEVAVYQPPASFEVVDRGSAEVIKFDNVGDVFVGRYEYTTRLTDDKGEIYPQAIFTGADAQPYCIFPGEYISIWFSVGVAYTTAANQELVFTWHVDGYWE